MKNSDIPAQVVDYVLEPLAGEYQLRHRGQDTAIYINQAAAIVWELCDGHKSAGEIKAMLRAAYPDAERRIDTDVHEVLAMLATHHALTTV